MPIMSIVWGLGVSAQRGAQHGKGERQREPGLERGVPDPGQLVTGT